MRDFDLPNHITQHEISSRRPGTRPVAFDRGGVRHRGHRPGRGHGHRPVRLFTPLLPLMVRDGSLAQSAGAWLAASNYLGYLAGALTASRLGLSLPTLMRASLVGIVVTTAAMGAFDGFATWIILRFVAGVLSAYTLVATSAWALERLTRAASSHLSGIIYAGVGLGVALTGLFYVAAAKPGC